MIFTNLALNNIGPYRGKHEFNLKPEVDGVNSKPVILFGGLNGAGKTQILESIKLVLYGSASIGTRVTLTKYHDLLKRRTHKSKKTGITENSASIILEFDHNFIGRTEHYTVIRSWNIDNGKVKEKLVVNKDGEPLNDLLMDQWQDFLKELVPPGLSNLFFFDGEKIKDILRQKGKIDQYIKEALGALLGLDTIDQLQSDLNLLAARQTKEMGGDSTLADNLQFAQENMGKLNDQMKDLKDEIEQNTSNVDGLKRDIERLEDQLSSLGGVFAEKRTSNKEKLTIVESELDGIKDQISQLLTETIPFALCPSISKSLLKRLDSEQDFEEKIAVSKVVDEFASKIKKEYKTDSKKLDKIVSKVSKEYAVDETEFQSRHDISKSDRDMMKNWIEDANNRAAKNLTTLCNQFESLSIESKSLSRSIGRAPPEKALSELVRDLGIKSEEVGKSEETIEALNYELQDVINQIADNDRKIEIIEKKLDDKSDVIEQIGLNRKVKAVLAEFFDDRSERKLEELEMNILSAFIALARKDRTTDKIKIDPKTMEILMYDSFDSRIHVADLSAGEQQVFAISILWALAKTADRPLPFIVDTPLSRLDSAHRGTLVNNFLSRASHQIFVLSTDTEIDKEYYEALQPHVSRAYHLNFNEDKASTEASPGYFWEDGGVKA